MRNKLILLLAVGLCTTCQLSTTLVAEDAPDPVDVRYGQVYAHTESDPLQADIYSPAGVGPFPGVLVVHGGAWHLGTRAQLAGAARLLAQRGMVAVAISYRLAPEHKFPAQIDDCRQALQWMRTQAKRLKIDPERIGGFGYSAGAQLVCLLGATGDADASTRLRAVACGGAPCEFRVFEPDEKMLSFWLGGTRRERPEQYRLASPAAFVTTDDPPMFFFHGEFDRLVPVASPQAMCDHLQQAGVEAELYVVPDMGHTFAAMDPTALKKSADFLARHLDLEETR